MPGTIQRGLTGLRGLRRELLPGRWRISRPFPPWLRPCLHSYDGYQETGAPVPYQVRIVPTGRAVVLINLREHFVRVRRLDDAGAGEAVGSLVAGLEDGPRLLDHPGGQEAIRLELTPLGAYRLFAVPLRELTNRVAALEDILGAGASLLVERLACTPDWAERFDLLDAALLERLASGPEPSPEVAYAWQLLVRSGGTVPAARLAEETGWSQGHLIRRFTQQVGLAPKTAARVLRFQRAVRMLAGAGGQPVEAAAACGYYDQAHLNREFRALGATTPGQVAASRLVEGTLSQGRRSQA